MSVDREALVEVAYRAWCDARRGGPMDSWEYEAIRSRVEFEWMHEVVDAILAAEPDGVSGEVETEWRVQNQRWLVLESGEREAREYASAVRAEHPDDPYRGRIEKRTVSRSPWTEVVA